MVKMGKTFGTIGYIAKNAIALAKEQNSEVEFEFNGVTLSVYPTSDYRDIVKLALTTASLANTETKHEKG